MIGLAGMCWLVLASSLPAATPPEKPPIPINLVFNSDFEIDADRDGVPDGWFHSEPQYWCGPAKDSERWKALRSLWLARGAAPDNIPFQPPGTLEGGSYKWETPGYRSDRAISIDETAEQKWGEWNTVVKDIKPNTNYVVLGWRKQAGPIARTSGVSPWMKIAVFGQMIPVRGTIDENTWIPFVIPVNSGTFQGKCALGIILERTPAKVWVDRLEMFEGTLADLPRYRFGHRGAELSYPFHSAAYVSPNLPCPLFFDLSWSFHSVEPNPGLEVLIDLPEGIDLTGGACDMGLKLGPPKPAERISISGTSYVRRAFPIVSADTEREFDPSGRRPLRFWIEIPPNSRFKADTAKAFYCAKWNNGGQAWQPLTIEVVRIPRVARWSRDFFAGIDGMSSELVASRAKKLVGEPPGETDFPAAGVNCIVLDTSAEPDVAEPFEKAGMSLAAWFQIDGTGAPDNALARNAAGNPIPGKCCPSFRSEDAIKTLFASPASLVRNGTTTLFIDLRGGSEPGCFCSRCTDAFESFVKKEHPGLQYVPPVELEGKPEQFKELRSAWDDFRCRQLANFYRTLREDLAKSRLAGPEPARNAGVPIRLVALVPSPSSGIESAKRTAMVDYGRMGPVFDFVLIEPDPYLAEMGGTPAWVGDEVAQLVRLLGHGGRAGAIITAGGAEDRNAQTPVVRHSAIRDQVLEATIAGARAVVLRPFYALDGKHIQQFSDALRLLAPFPEILAEGEPSSAVRAAEGGAASVRCLGKGKQLLVLVADYSLCPAAEVKLEIELGETAGNLVWVDVEAATIVSQLDPGAKNAVLPLRGSCARLFYLGPHATLPIKVVEAPR